MDEFFNILCHIFNLVIFLTIISCLYFIVSKLLPITSMYSICEIVCNKISTNNDTQDIILYFSTIFLTVLYLFVSILCDDEIVLLL